MKFCVKNLVSAHSVAVNLNKSRFPPSAHDPGRIRRSYARYCHCPLDAAARGGAGAGVDGRDGGVRARFLLAQQNPFFNTFLEVVSN